MADLLTIKNKYNIDIVMCCASCKRNMGAKTENTRVCEISKLPVKPSHFCSSWRMREALDNAGKGGGTIKKKHYLEWLKDYQNPAALTLCLEDRITEYERQYGSRYVVK